jgi:hypothetical protein
MKKSSQKFVSFLYIVIDYENMVDDEGLWTCQPTGISNDSLMFAILVTYLKNINMNITFFFKINFVKNKTTKLINRNSRKA